GGWGRKDDVGVVVIQEVRHHDLRGVADAIEIEADHPVPVPIAYFVQFANRAAAGVAVQDVESPELLDRGVDGTLPVSFLRDIAVDECRLAALLLDQLVDTGCAGL